jgi:predicted GTPase
MEPHRILVLGAAGRDFHLFNTLYRDNPAAEVVAFTAQQIPHIDDRRYPPELAGELYPDGIPILPEDQLEDLILEHDVEMVVLGYSDLAYAEVGHLMARATSVGADFLVPDAWSSMVESSRPVVAVCAVRTGVGKSQTSRAVAKVLRDAGLRVGIVRHPMPYGDLVRQRVQRFASEADLVAHDVTIEEREEYEPHIAAGSVVYAGVDYEAILHAAEAESDVILWDGGNNDTPFYVPDVLITLVDPHRPGHESGYYPGETNLRMADVVLINKIDTADARDVDAVVAAVERLNDEALVMRAASPITPDDPSVLAGKRVLVVEDGPTCTHGGMAYGAGLLGARAAGAREIVDPRPFLVGELKDTFARYPDLGPILPAMGYGQQQVRDLEATLRKAAEAGVEAIAVGTPIDLARLVDMPLPHTRCRYELSVRGAPTLAEILDPVIHIARGAVPREEADAE